MKEQECIRALFIGAHEDECEYGPGGAAYLLHQAGVHTRFYNTCVLRSQYSKELIEYKYKSAMDGAEYLGAEKNLEEDVAPVWVCNENHVENILHEIIDYKPHIVFIHYPKDNHSEHREVAKASYQALGMAPANGWHCKEVYAYEAGPDQTVQYMTPDFVIDISDIMDVLKECYYKFGDNLGAGLYGEKLVGASFRGMKCGYAYGEAYKIVKFPDKGEDFMLRKLLADRFCWFGNEYYAAYGEMFF